MKNLLFLCGLLALPTILPAQTPTVGDTLRGGIVCFINETGDTALICGKSDALQFGDWAEAKARCENYFSIWGGTLHRDWRMPTLDEMKIIRAGRDVLNPLIVKNGGIAFDSEIGSYYWTSTEGKYDSQAWLQAFGFDTPFLMNKTSNTFNARAVQTVFLK